MSSILEELKKKRAEEGKSYLDISTENDYSGVEKADKERQEQLKTLEEAVAKFRTPYIDYKENPNTIQSIPLEDESFSRPAGDTMQSNQGNNPSKLGPNPITGLGRLANTAETAKDVIVGDVANQLANIKVGIAANPVFQTAKIDANQLLDYANGNHNIVNSLAVKRLENSEPAKTIAPVAVMLDEIKKGTYKGTAEDIQKTLKYGDDTSYAKWYNQKIANLEGGFLNIHNPQDMMKADQQMYGNTAGTIMNTVASGGAKIGEFITNASLLGPVYAGVMSGLTRDSSGNVQQIRNEGLDQVARDIGVDVSLGALFSYLMGETTGAINSAIQNAIPKSVLSKAGMIAKNVVSGAGGAYASVGTTGTLRNIYNKLQGREVSQEEAIHPWWSVDTGIATFMGALFNGINGTKSDLAKAEQIKAVMNKQGELNAKLSAYSKDIAKQFEAANQQGVEESYNNGRQAIEEFFNRNNLGKVTNTLKNEYLRQWFEYNYDLGVAYENATAPSSQGTTTPTQAMLSPTTAQSTTTIPPLTTVPQTQPNTAITPSATQSTGLANTANGNVASANREITGEGNAYNNIGNSEDEQKLAEGYEEQNKDSIKAEARLSPERLQGIIHHSAVEDAKEWHKNYGNMYITRMSPQEYLDLTATPSVLKQREAETGPLDPEKLQYGKDDLDASGGIRPANNIYLTVDMKTGEIEGQEGYHRIIALKNAGVKSVDVLIWPYESTINKDNLQNIKELNVTGMNGNKGVLKDLDAVTYNNIDYLKEKYLGYDKDNAYIMEPTDDDYEYELLADKTAFIDTEEGSKAWKEYQEKEKVQDDIRMQILQEMEQKGYVEHRVENGDVKDYLTEKGMQNKAEVDEYQKRFYAALDETQRLRDEYDKLEKAYEEEQKRKFYKNSTQGSFSAPEKLPKKILGSQRKLLKEFKQVGYIDINGNKIESVEDFVDLCQIFRDPLAETTRFVFLDDDNIVVGETAITSYSVNHVSWGDLGELFPEIEKAARACNATKFYFMHNHPTGDVEASTSDKKVSKDTLEYFNRPYSKLKYLGDVIIDHNKYTHIKPLNDGKISITENIKMKTDTLNEIEQYMSNDGWTKMKIDSRDMIAQLASLVTNKEDYSSLMLLNYHRMPMLLQELPNQFFYQKSDFLKNYIKDLAKRNGAAYACIGTTDPVTLQEIGKKNLQLQDAVCYEPLSDGSINIISSLRRAGKLGQETIFKRANKHENVLPTKDSPKFDLEEARKAKLEKKEPAKRLEKKKPEPKPEPDKRLGFDAVDKDKEALEKANDKLRDELAKQKKEYEERLKKKDEALEKFKQTKKEQKGKQKLKLKKREEKKKEEQRFKGATPKGKLRMLGRKIEKQTGYYEINNYPELDKKYEEEFGKTIRQTIQTLKTRDIYPYLPAKFQDIVDTFADETYLKANWKTFDKYVKEALQIDEIKKLIEESDTPVAQKLLGIVREHKTAPITIKTAKEMYEDLQILEDIVELAQERLDYRREPEGWKETVDKAGEELKEIAEGNTPKSFSTTSAKLGKASDNLQSLGSAFSQFKTRIQELFGGDPENPFMRIWDEFQAGDETKAKLDVLFSRNFDGLVEGKPGKYKMKGELQKDFSPNAKPIDTGIKGTNPKTGKEYSENAMLPKKIIMHIVASSKNDDNLMSFSKILLGTDYKGNPVYSNPGGYIVPDDYYLQRGNINLAYKNGKKYVFTKQDIEHLEKLLTPEEKEFVDAALKVGDITAKYGNEVSQKLIGRDLFTVKNYIRIIRDESEFDPELINPTELDNLANATSQKFIGISGLLGRGGSLEGRNHRSTRPIYGESLRQSVTNSFRGAIKYIAYALPLYDTDFLLKARLPDTFEQVETVEKEPKSTKDLTYKKVDELPRNGADHTRYYIDNGDHYTVYRAKEKGETVRDLIIKTGDKGFDDYYNQFVDSIVGKGKPYSKFSSMRAKVVLNANLRVAATQFFSYFQMGQFLDHPASSMLKAIADRGTIAKLAKDFLEKDGKDIKGLKGQELINRFIEYVSYKNSQRGLGMFSDDIRYVETGNSVLGRVNTGRLMSIVDKFTVDRTYKALIIDIMAEGKEFGSKEFMDEFKSRLYAIYQSNPMYGEIYKTPFQNNSGRYSEITRALSQFQTVMFEGFNNGKQAKMAYEYYKKKGDEKNAKKYAKRFRHYVQGLIISGLTLAALKDYYDRLAGKENDEEYAKKITMDFISNMLSYTIVGDEIFNAILNRNDYDLTTNELSYFNSAFDALGDLTNVAKEPKPPKIIKAIKSLGQALGIPANSMENIFGILSNLTPGNAFSAYSVLKDNNKYQKWLKNQDAIGTDFKTFYEISQAVKEKTLAEKYGYVKGSETGTYGSLSYAKGRAIMDVLGIEQGKKMTKEQKQAYSKWYNIFKN